MASIERRNHAHCTRWRVIWWDLGVREQVTFDSEGEARRFKEWVERRSRPLPPGALTGIGVGRRRHRLSV